MSWMHKSLSEVCDKVLLLHNINTSREVLILWIDKSLSGTSGKEFETSNINTCRQVLMLWLCNKGLRITRGPLSFLLVPTISS